MEAREGPGARDELASVLYAATETLRILAVAIGPIMPGAAERLWSQLGLAELLADQRFPDAGVWGAFPVGTTTTKGRRCSRGSRPDDKPDDRPAEERRCAPFSTPCSTG